MAQCAVGCGAVLVEHVFLEFGVHDVQSAEGPDPQTPLRVGEKRAHVVSALLAFDGADTVVGRRIYQQPGAFGADQQLAAEAHQHVDFRAAAEWEFHKALAGLFIYFSGGGSHNKIASEHGQCGHVFVTGAIGAAELSGLGAEYQQPAGCAHGYLLAAKRQDGVDSSLTRQRIVDEIAVGKGIFRQRVCCCSPDCPVGVGCDCSHEMVGGIGRESVEAIAVVTVQSVGGGDPYISETVLADAVDGGVREAFVNANV